MKFSQIELKELLKAWVAISLAFAILLNRGVKFNLIFLLVFLFSGLTVGIGFLFHELAHKFMAQRYHCWAEFRANTNMLFLAVIMSFFGFIIAAPGAVFIRGHVNHEQNGKISMAGPSANIILAVLFLALNFLYPVAFFRYGFIINTWLGLFNLIPFGNFDGAKIFRWNKPVYSAMVFSAGILMFLIFL